MGLKTKGKKLGLRTIRAKIALGLNRELGLIPLYPILASMTDRVEGSKKLGREVLNWQFLVCRVSRKTQGNCTHYQSCGMTNYFVSFTLIMLSSTK